MSGEQYTDDQLARFASRAGFNGNARVIAVAVALAESSGTNAVGDINNPRQGCSSIGPWQINNCPGMNTGFRDPAKLPDPQFNAQAAYSISAHGVNWQPWTTYRNGAYKKFMTRAEKAVELAATQTPEQVAGNVPAPIDNATGKPVTKDKAGADDGGVIASDPLGALQSLAKQLSGIGDFFAFIADPHNWLRIAEFVGGAMLGIVALVIINRDSIGRAAEVAAVA